MSHADDDRSIVLLQCHDCGHYTTFALSEGDLGSAGEALSASFWKRVRCSQCRRVSTSWSGVFHRGLPEGRWHGSHSAGGRDA